MTTTETTVPLKTVIRLFPDGAPLPESVTDQPFQVKVLENGNLEFSIAHLLESEFEELNELYQKLGREDLLFGQVFETSLHEDFYFVPSTHYSEINALTDAPILSDFDFWNADEAEQEFTVEMQGLRLWWYPQYELKNAFEELLIHGKVEFETVPQ